MAKTMKQILEEREMTQEYLPEEYRTHYQLAEYNYALTHIHFPENRKDMVEGRKRLVFDEFLLFILSVRMRKEKNQDSENTFHLKPVWETEKIIENLPYALTNAQKRVWNEIETNMTGEHLMSRLVQGDVGSGKTIIAFLAMILTAANGCQAALMAPTEALARQHYEGTCQLLAEQGLSYPAVLLTGSTHG